MKKIDLRDYVSKKNGDPERRDVHLKTYNFLKFGFSVGVIVVAALVLGGIRGCGKEAVKYFSGIHAACFKTLPDVLSRLGSVEAKTDSTRVDVKWMRDNWK